MILFPSSTAIPTKTDSEYKLVKRRYIYIYSKPQIYRIVRDRNSHPEISVNFHPKFDTRDHISMEFGYPDDMMYLIDPYPLYLRITVPAFEIVECVGKISTLMKSTISSLTIIMSSM